MVTVFDVLIIIAACLSVIAVLYYIYKTFRKRDATECGHRSRLRGKVTAFGESAYITMKPDKNGNIKYCHGCLEEMTIQCAWCGKPIFIGNPVTLYTPVESYKYADYAVVHNEDPLQLVGCGRASCADTGADYAGVWVPPGEVKRIPTLYEKSMMDMESGGDGAVAATH